MKNLVRSYLDDFFCQIKSHFYTSKIKFVRHAFYLKKIMHIKAIVEI